jgi:hypothetical protein
VIGNPIDLIHGEAAARVALVKLAVNKDIDLIAAELVKVEADRTAVFEEARLELFEPRDKARPAEEHAGGAGAARGQIAAKVCELSVRQPASLMEQKER